MTPVLSEDQMAETVKKYAKMVVNAKGEVIFEDNWGLKKLAYPIQKKSTGYYHTMEFRVAGEEIANMELLLKRDEKILRFLTVKLDKHAIAYNIKKREKAKDTVKTEEKAEEKAEEKVDEEKTAVADKKEKVEDKKEPITAEN